MNEENDELNKILDYFKEIPYLCTYKLNFPDKNLPSKIGVWLMHGIFCIFFFPEKLYPLKRKERRCYPMMTEPATPVLYVVKAQYRPLVFVLRKIRSSDKKPLSYDD
jgi:hypothetical protein